MQLGCGAGPIPVPGPLTRAGVGPWVPQVWRKGPGERQLPARSPVGRPQGPAQLRPSPPPSSPQVRGLRARTRQVTTKDPPKTLIWQPAGGGASAHGGGPATHCRDRTEDRSQGMREGRGRAEQRARARVSRFSGDVQGGEPTDEREKRQREEVGLVRKGEIPEAWRAGRRGRLPLPPLSGCPPSPLSLPSSWYGGSKSVLQRGEQSWILSEGEGLRPEAVERGVLEGGAAAGGRGNRYQ